MNPPNWIHTSITRAFALALILGALTGTDALAGQPAAVTVKYSDLDLATGAGARTLYRRIASAARDVCGLEGTSNIEHSLWMSCYRGAIADAVAYVNSPLLTALYGGGAADPKVAMLRK